MTMSSPRNSKSFQRLESRTPFRISRRFLGQAISWVAIFRPCNSPNVRLTHAPPAARLSAAGTRVAGATDRSSRSLAGLLVLRHPYADVALVECRRQRVADLSE